MHSAQRVLLVIVMIFICGIAVSCHEQENKLQGQWETVQTERFLKKLCRTEYISREEYLQYTTALNYKGTASEIRIEEYQREWDAEGSLYYYLISWEEILRTLTEKGNYTFETGSVVKITISRQSRRNQVRNSYHGIISGKE